MTKDYTFSITQPSGDQRGWLAFNNGIVSWLYNITCPVACEWLNSIKPDWVKTSTDAFRWIERDIKKDYLSLFK
jgi:hypothetical protein